jgi:hypothetical protein
VITAVCLIAHKFVSEYHITTELLSLYKQLKTPHIHEYTCRQEPGASHANDSNPHAMENDRMTTGGDALAFCARALDGEGMVG